MRISQKQGLRIVLRKNESGRIYDITFIDDANGIALNGSRLGKGYSANTFNTYLSNPTYNPLMDETLYGTSSSQLKEVPTVQPLQSDADDGDNLVDELEDDIVGDLPLGSSNDDWKEAAWQRKLRRQNRIRLKENIDDFVIILQNTYNVA